MAAPTFTANAPTGRYVAKDAPLLVSIAHGTGVNESTVSIVLTDPLATTSNPVTNGTWDGANEFVGDIVVDGTGCDVLLRSHPDWMAGSWSVTVTADSDVGGEVGTKTWTFQVGSELSGVFDGIIELMEGDTGVGRTMPANEFRYLRTVREGEESRLAPAGRTRPFLLSRIGPGDPGETPGNLSGDYVYSAHIIRMTVLYSIENNDPLDLEQEIVNHEKRIREVLEWPRNFHLYEGWCNSEVVNSAVEEGATDNADKPNLLFAHYDINVQTRELHE